MADHNLSNRVNDVAVQREVLRRRIHYGAEAQNDATLLP